MTTRPTPDVHDATGSPTDDAVALPRRGLLRGGAVLAGVAAGAAVAMLPSPAAAADGDNVVLGADNAASTTTSVTIGGDTGSSSAALSVTNVDGPALRLEPLPDGWTGQLEIGDLAGSDLGPIVGVDTLSGTATTYLVTGVDLANVPSPFPSEPKRLIDLRTASGRSAIIRRSSSTALAADGKLRAGQWIDIGIVLTAPDYVLDAIFANLTVVAPAGSGFAQLYPPGVRPGTSSINYVTGQTLANAAFVGTGAVLGQHAVRLYTSRDAWFLVDVTGGVSRGSVSTPLQQARARAAGGRAALNRRLSKALGQVKR